MDDGRNGKMMRGWLQFFFLGSCSILHYYGLEIFEDMYGVWRLRESLLFVWDGSYERAKRSELFFST